MIKSCKFKKKELLKIKFYNRSTETVARELLGKYLVRDLNGLLMSGIIVETEAYYGLEDPASHSYRGMTPRAKIMFGHPGVAYVYLCYGMYHLLNVVTEKNGFPGAVLIRAIEPLEGIVQMKENRGIDNLKDLTNGPGKLTKALCIGMAENGKSLTEENSPIRLYTGLSGGFTIKSATRIGINKGREKELRYYIEGNKHVSKC